MDLTHSVTGRYKKKRFHGFSRLFSYIFVASRVPVSTEDARVGALVSYYVSSMGDCRYVAGNYFALRV